MGQKFRRQGFFWALMSQEGDVENEMSLGEGQESSELWCSFNQWQRNFYPNKCGGSLFITFFKISFRSTNIDMWNKVIVWLGGARDGKSWDPVGILWIISQLYPNQANDFFHMIRLEILKLCKKDGWKEGSSNLFLACLESPTNLKILRIKTTRI